MIRHIVLFVVTLGAVLGTEKITVDYYWRPYEGAGFPDDAVPGGDNEHGERVFIGQGLAKEADLIGNIPATIYPGKDDIEVCLQSPITVDYDVKILASSSTYNFKWIPTTSTSFYNSMINRVPVLGGTLMGIKEKRKRPLYIGRVFQEGQYVVGKLMENVTDSSVNLFFVLDKQIWTYPRYEVLVYEPY